MTALNPQRLLGIRRGIEKESLRAKPNGSLALTPHPLALGSALTHPHITTDYSESQLELITGVHAGVQECLDELKALHQVTCQVLDQSDEMMWVSSMPCGLPTDETIPLGVYGSSNIGRAKSVYRMGLGHRYGRRMQTISGIHYNWSVPDVSNAQYFGLIRNFRRHLFLLLYLYGASPALCSTFVEGRTHSLTPLKQGSLHMPYATSLRMGRLGYKSDAQASLAVSYNDMDGYGASLEDALTRPYPAYEKIGIRNIGGEYNQLATTLLQIENEFYGSIRPKRVIRSGERPLHALRERGVEYIEVRCMDLDPFEPLGIAAPTLRFLDAFLLHCLHTESPADTPDEIAALARNQHRVAERGREPGLTLERGTSEVSLKDWGLELVSSIRPYARALDAAHDVQDYSDAVDQAQARLEDASLTPSARVLAVTAQHQNSFVQFVRAQSISTRQILVAQPLSKDAEQLYAKQAQESLAEQKRIEAADAMPFEEFRQGYVSPERLVA